MIAKDLIEKWIGEIKDPRKLFKEIDTDNSGNISFDEFCDWSTKINLGIDKANQEETEELSTSEIEDDKDIEKTH